MDDNVFHTGILTLSGLAVAALCWLVKQGSAWLVQRTKSAAIATFYGRLDQLAEKVVKDVYQSTVAGLQASNNWNAETARVARDQAISKLKSYIGMEGLHMLEFLAGAGGKASLDEFLGTFVEAAVVDSKPLTTPSADSVGKLLHATGAVVSKATGAPPPAATVNPT